jgi:hypothetical protein
MRGAGRKEGSWGGWEERKEARLDTSTYIAWPRRGGSPRSASRSSLLAPVLGWDAREGVSAPSCVSQAHLTTPRTLPSRPCRCRAHLPTYLGALAAGDALDEGVDHGGGAGASLFGLVACGWCLCVWWGGEWVTREGDEVVVMIVPRRGALLTPCDAAAAPLPSLKTVPRQA